jgi:predicted ATP-grasp superfamily ATP-dependent carboligase
MTWRDDIKLAVAKRMHDREEKQREYMYCRPARSWDNIAQPFKDEWITKAEHAIRDSIDGAQDAGWRVDFVGKDDTYHKRDSE